MEGKIQLLKENKTHQGPHNSCLRLRSAAAPAGVAAAAAAAVAVAAAAAAVCRCIEQMGEFSFGIPPVLST